ncbi:MAG: sigma-70 family RNA polymerase sigma factor [Gemmataceae bacterium]|nr:sigma-70 family RNA polymerase sigma factor [Gemmataceae bacterium]
MSNIQGGDVLRHIRSVLEPPDDARRIDRELLREYAAGQDQAAFAALVRRHGKLVLGVCRRVLGDPHDAEDAFQATFLVLARKAGAIRKQCSLSSWLYGVAYRMALKARVGASRRRRREQAVAARSASTGTDDLTWREIRSVIDEEMNALADKYRAPLLLCYFEGKTQDEAAQQLGWSLGTFRRRLDDARERLQVRLRRRGLALAAALSSALLAQDALGALPTNLLPRTVEAAIAFAAEKPVAASLVTTSVVPLAQEALKAMFRKQLAVAAVLCLAVALLGAGVGLLRQSAIAGGAAAEVKEPEPAAPQPSADPPMPRRMLAICVSNYYYANPINYGTGNKAMHRVVRQLGELLGVPDAQMTVLSDKAPTPYPPSRQVVGDTLDMFLDDCCGEQDRIVVTFVGHAVMLDETPYLMPIDGVAESKETLIALPWLYERLAKCKARQKVLILDVCRFDPSRGTVRGRVEKMAAAWFDAAMNKTPEGVEVLTACTAGQFSLEYERKGSEVEGGVFLGQVVPLLAAGGLKGVEQKPEKPLPMDALATALGERTRAATKSLLGREQAPRLAGKEANADRAFDATKVKTSRPPIAYTPDPNLAGKRGAVMRILSLYQQVPSVHPGDKERNPLRFETMPAFSQVILKEFQDDEKVSAEFRRNIEEGVALLRKEGTRFTDTFAPLPQNPQQRAQITRQIEAQQQNLAVGVLAQLQRQLTELDDLQGDRDAQSKLWQANYDYVRVQVLWHMAYALEYSAALGKIRKDDLPALDKNLHVGYRLVPTPTLSEKEADKYVDQAKKILEKMAKDHKGTPWELIAKRELATNRGLEWQPY